MDPKFNALLDRLLDFKTSFNAMSMEGLPEALSSRIIDLKKAINEGLKDLPPLDQIPAALDAARSIEWLQTQLANVTAWSSKLMESLEQTVGKLKEASVSATALNALNARVASGELVEAASLENKVADGVKSYAELMKTRRLALCSASIPLPMDDTFLAGTDAEWDARLADARRRVGLFADKKVPLPTDASKYAVILFGPPESFAAVEAVLDVKSGAAAPAGGGKPGQDPLKGAGGKPPGGGTTPKMA